MANPVITNITGYINETKLGLIGKVFNGADSMEYLNKQSGIKGATQLTLLDTTVQFADGTVCGWDPKGADTFSKRVIEPALIKVQKAWCPDVLFKTWMNEQLNYAASGTEMTDAKIAEVVVGQQVTEVSKALEKAIWQGKKTTDLFDGLATIIKASNAVKYEYATGATVSSIVDAVIEKVPEDAYSMGDVVIYMGKDMYRKYLQELRANGNLVLNMAYDDLRAPKSVIAPLTDVRVIGVSGLNNTGEAYASFANNFIYGTDLINGPEDVSFKYVDYDETYHLNIKFVAGTQVAFPALIVYAVEQA